VTTDEGAYEADVVVVALGADYDLAATPGLAEGMRSTRSPKPKQLGELLPSFSQGHAIVGVCGGAVQIPAGAERGRAPAGRLSVGARRPRSSCSGAGSPRHPNAQDWFATFKNLRLEPEEFLDLGDKLLVTIQWRGHGSGSGVAFSQPMFPLFHFRRGFVVKQEDFVDPSEALEAVGLRDG